MVGQWSLSKSKVTVTYGRGGLDLEMNEHEIHRIAKAVNVLRPDWPEASLVTFITARLGDRPRRDVLIALGWVACDSTTATPARVLESGPWWKACVADVDPQHRVRHPPKREQECRVHPGEYADHCRVCNAPKAYDDPNPVPSLPGQADPNRWATEARQRIRDAKGPAA